MNDKILQLLNEKYKDEPEYTGFTLMAHNEEGLRLIQHHISEFDQMMQTMILIKECQKEQPVEKDVEKKHVQH